MTTLLKQHARQIFQAGVAAADPYQTVKRCLHLDELPTGKIHLIAFGKAACAMAQAAIELIPASRLASTGIAVTNYENVRAVDNVEVIGAGHPLPDTDGFFAAQKIAERVSQAQADELVLVLISGGGSALLPYPVANISLAEKIATTDLLLACGASINEINCVRKHLSQLKGGGLARLAFPAKVHALILSDVLGDDLSTIASGTTVPDNSTYSQAIAVLQNKNVWARVPESVQQHFALILSDVLGDDLSTIASGTTVPDNSTYSQAIAVLQNKNVWARVPESVQQHLEKGTQGLIAETPKADDVVFKHTSYVLCASNTVSLKAAQIAAEQLGYHTQIYSEQLCGIARDEAEKLAIYATQQHIVPTLQRGNAAVDAPASSTKPLAILAGGETTVNLKGTGKGGRNQEFSLAFAIAAEKHGLTAQWTLLSGGTDGRDGPTDAAGGIVDANSLQNMINAGVNPSEYLNNNNAYHALNSSNNLLITGATGTNVADLQILLLHP